MLRGEIGRMVALRDGRYDSVPIDTVVAYKKVVDVEQVLRHRALPSDRTRASSWRRCSCSAAAS